MAFSTIDDEQWFTALPADLTSTPSVDDHHTDTDTDTAERVVALPPPSPEPAWAGALANYTPQTTERAQPRPASSTSAVAPERSWIHRHRSAIAVTGSVAALAALVGGGALLLTGASEDNDVIAAEPIVPSPAAATELSTTEPAASSAVVVSAEQWCEVQSGGTRALASSSEPDLAAIARIEDAYYVSRDISAARAQLSAGIDLDSAAFEAAVAAIPVGTDHCVLTSPLGSSQYRVTVIERRPDGEEKRFSSAMTVQRGPNNAASISGIGQAPQ